MHGNCIPGDEVANEIVERSTRVVSLDCLLSWPAIYRFIEYTWKNVARTIYITIMRARRRLYRALPTLTLQRLKQKHIADSAALLVKSALNVASVIVRSVRSARKKKKIFMVLFSAKSASEGSPRKSKVESLFSSEAVTRMTRGFLIRHLLTMNPRASPILTFR